MHETSVPLLVDVDAGSNLTDLVADAAAEQPDAVLYRVPADGGWRDVTATELLREVSGLAKGLMASGVGPGDRVALMSRTRYEWTLVDLAIWFAGAVTVPVYETSSPDQVRWVLADSGAVALVVETGEHASVAAALREEVPAVTHVWCIDDGELKGLEATGRHVPDEDLETRRTTAGLEDLATIIYTSGTTGRPKGCELTHGNFRVVALNATQRLAEVVRADGATTLLFIPLAHVFARFVQILALTSRATLAHSPDVSTLAADLSSVRPTFLLSVPRVFEKIYNASEQRAEGDGKGRIFRQAADVAVAWSRAQDTGGPGLTLRARHALFDRLVYPRLRAALGGRATYAVSGGAPLGERLGHFFRGVGLTVLEGYGLTETTAPTSVNVPERVKIGTVGPQLPGCSARIAADGEIQLRGPHVFRGYWNNPAATAEAFVDGWFRTGDLGALDEDGYLSITGRSKEIIVTAGGKNVAPAVLEDRLRAHPLVSQCVVVGDARPFVGALVTLDTEMLPTWLKNQGLAQLSVSEAATDETVLTALQEAVDGANAAVSRAESVRAFRVLADDFSIETGHLTPSMKLKRDVVLADYADEVEKLYADHR